MKPIPAIVEPAQLDLDLLERQIAVALQGQRDAERTQKRHEDQASNAREVAKQRRLEIGGYLLKARAAWPERGPKAKGWGEFLGRIQMAESTARMYLDEARDPKGFAERRASSAKPDDEAPGQPDDDDGQTGPRIGPRIEPAPCDPAIAPLFRQPTEAELIQFLGRLDPESRKRVLKADKANVKGGSGEPDRGKWCTSRKWATAVGAWDLDPFSNPRSQILSVSRCMLEDGGDAFGGGEPGATLGLYLTGTNHGLPATSGIADSSTRVWLQPPYESVESAIAHYGHTRFCALLRWSPDVKAWFPQLWARTAVVAHPFGERMEFDPPPGVDKSGDMPFPHALYYADERDVTPAVRALCIVWRVDHSLDCAQPNLAALHIVR